MRQWFLVEVLSKREANGFQRNPPGDITLIVPLLHNWHGIQTRLIFLYAFGSLENKLYILIILDLAYCEVAASRVEDATGTDQTND